MLLWSQPLFPFLFSWSPAQGVRKFKEKSRDRFLKRDEMPRFFAALAQEENEARAQIQYIAMRWSEMCEEHAAIMEFDGGLPRLEAERLAYEFIRQCMKEEDRHAKNQIMH